MRKCVAIVGPTASGKSRIAVEVASLVHAEIISCDSVQVYRHVDIGSGKIKEAEMVSSTGYRVPHHMLDVYEPQDDYSVYDYQQDARRVIDNLSARHQIPLICGGTGLYLRSVIDEYCFSKQIPEKTSLIKSKYQFYLEEHGPEALYFLLQEKDPITSQKIHPHNVRRILRALERSEEEVGQSLRSGLLVPHYAPLMFGLMLERSVLYSRIEKRVDRMMQDGLLEEVKYLLQNGVDSTHKVMQTLGYRHMLLYLQHEVPLDEAIRLMKRDTRRYAKRQYTWFKADARIQWLSVETPWEEQQAIKVIEKEIQQFFRK